MFCHHLPSNQEADNLQWKGKEIRFSKYSVKTIPLNTVQESSHVWIGSIAFLLILLLPKELLCIIFTEEK